jgi:glucosamine kinase
MRLDPSTYLIPAGLLPRAARYWVGVDGGGTGTRAVLADASGRVLARGEAGPSALGQGAEQAWRHIREAVSHAAAAAGIAGVSLDECHLSLGLSGTGVPAQVTAFLDELPPVAGLALLSDGLAGVLGAHGGAPGAVLVAGTGSVGEALLPDGSRRLVGGWGWMIGDEGSGAWLGQRAMRRAQAAFDGREPVGPLVRAVWRVAGTSREALLAWCAAAGQGGYATLAPLVFEHEATDPAAAADLAAAVQSLEALVAALDPSAQLPLALVGSIAKRLAPRFPSALQARLTEPQGDACDGALCLIRHLISAPTHS